MIAAKKRPFNTSKDNKPILVYTDLPPDMKKARGTAAGAAKQMRSEGKQARIRVTGIRVMLEHRGKSRNRRTFSKIANLRFLQNYDDYNCIFGIKLKGLSLSFI